MPADIFQVHDHFDGSANCVQCAGRCQLTGTEMALTYLVRCVFIQHVYMMTKSALEAVCDFEAFAKRAR